MLFLTGKSFLSQVQSIAFITCFRTFISRVSVLKEEGSLRGMRLSHSANQPQIVPYIDMYV